MCSHKNTISSETVYKQAMQVVQSHLAIKDYGPKCTAETVVKILFYAASHCGSVFMACQRLRNSPSDQAVRNALTACFSDPGDLEEQLNEALGQQLPKNLKKRRWRLAIDLTLIPYHGQPQQDEEEIYRNQAKGGTTHFHAYATCYLVHKGQRFTVALSRVTKNEPMTVILKRLLRLVSRAGIHPKLLLLDRGFYSVEVIRYLQRARYPFLMPVIYRGRNVNDPRGPSGTNVFATHKQSGWSIYTLTNAQQQKATVQIAVHCHNWKGAWNRQGRQTLTYAFWGFQPKTTQWIYQTYRTRFGIETSYRQMNEARIKTSTRNPALRLLFFGLAMILRNVWVWFHFHVLSTPRKGGRKFNLERLRFRTLLVWLVHIAENDLGFYDSLNIDRNPLTWNY